MSSRSGSSSGSRSPSSRSRSSSRSPSPRSGSRSGSGSRSPSPSRSRSPSPSRSASDRSRSRSGSASSRSSSSAPAKGAASKARAPPADSPSASESRSSSSASPKKPAAEPAKPAAVARAPPPEEKKPAAAPAPAPAAAAAPAPAAAAPAAAAPAPAPAAKPAPAAEAEKKAEAKPAAAEPAKPAPPKDDKSGSSRSRSKSPSRSNSRSRSRSRSRSPSRSPSRSDRSRSRSNRSRSRSRSESPRSRSPSPSRSEHTSPRRDEKRSNVSGSSVSKRSNRSGSDKKPSPGGKLPVEERSGRSGSSARPKDDFSFDESDEDDYEELVFGPGQKNWFCELPQPQNSKGATQPIADTYIRGLQENIDTLRLHVLTIQDEEVGRMNKFRESMEAWDPKAKGEKMSDQENKRKEFKDSIRQLRESRRRYRSLLWDALQERNKALVSGEKEMRTDKEYRLLAKSLTPDTSIDWLLAGFVLLQIVIVLCYLIFIQFPDNGFLLRAYEQGEVANNPLLNPEGDVYVIRGTARNADATYSHYSNFALLVFLGFGLLWSIPRKATWTALGLTVLVGAYAMELGILLNGWMGLAHLGKPFQKIYLTPITLIEAIYCAAACVISYGAIIGQMQPFALLFTITVEVILYAVNYYIGASVLDSQDFGRSAFVHLFGGLFGLATAWSLGFFNNDAYKPKELKSSTWSNIISTLGCLICLALFPSFNTALSQYWSVDLAIGSLKPGNGQPIVGPNNGSQYRSLENTIIATMGATVVGFALSKINNGKLKWSELHTCIIAGGISMSSAANIIVDGWTALLIGACAAMFAFLSLKFLQNGFQEAFKLRDVRNVFSTFVMPAFFACVVSFLCTIIWIDSDRADNARRFGQDLRDLFSRRPITLRNAAAFASSVGLPLLGGGIIGLVINGMKETFPHLEPDERLTDQAYFHVPIDA